MSRLDLAALEIFRQVARDGSVSRAAERLNRVQSNISTRVKQIEDQVGVPLFERGRHGMTLTDDGQTLLDYAEDLLNLSEQAVDAVAKGEPRGVLRIGTMESTAASRLPPILSRFHGENPNVEVRVRTDVAGALIDQLVANQIDVAFVAEPIDNYNLNTLPVFEEDLVLLTPRSSPRIGIETLSGKTVIAFEEGCAYRRYLDQWLMEAGIVPGKILSMGSYLGIFACVSAGTGFGVAPESVIDSLTSHDEIQCHKLGGRYTSIKTMMVWRTNYSSQKLTALINVLSDRTV